MKNKSPQLILMAVLVAGVFFLFQRGRGASTSRIRHETAHGNPSAARPTLPVSAGPAIAASDEPYVRRAVSEVFPGVSSPVRDWRHAHPRTVSVAPYPGAALTFQQARVKEDGRHLTWVGLNAALPGASFVGVATTEGYDAVLMLPGAGQFNFHARDGQVLIEEVVASGKDCELAPGGVGMPRGISVPPAVMYAEAGGNAGGVAPVTGATSAAEGVANVDVLFLYNTRALAVAADRSTDPVGYIDGYARAGLETCNQVLLNSRIENFAWRYAGLLAAPEYPEKATVSEDLAMMAPEGGPLDSFVRAARAEYGADQVLMWVGAGTRQGAAYTGDVRGEAVPVEWSLAGLRLTAGILILAHELAHNFGCHHDRGHAGTGDGSTATPEGDGRWCYGLLWNDPGLTTTSGTIMAYADYLVPHFSNPDITLNITSTLQNRPGPFRDLGTRAIGFAENDPRAANNARVMREHALHMAALQEEAETMPIILQQPTDATVPAGQNLQLAVSATGGGLGYQWSKDGAAIPGATSATFFKNFTAADAGGYSVRIANRRGTVTSRTATVTVSAAAAPAPTPTPIPPAPATSSGGGGGGGGAPSFWFLFALGALGWLRRRRL